MVHHDVILPPCVYPAEKPYHGFTTLVHRYGRYDRIRSSLIDDCSIDTRSSSSTSSSPPSGSQRFELNSIQESEDVNQTLIRTRSVGGAMVTKRDMNRAIEAISYQLNKPSMREYQDQRVVLSPKKEIKLELARMGSAVEKFYRSVSINDSISGSLLPDYFLRIEPFHSVLRLHYSFFF
ncbi:hypothetical protein BJ742DRAFT_51312 [Cladochytrium replicatum]|nr:hypothetical protein BJ742DRAFT_51312 [Cladochytrium replicatum]